VCFAVGCWARAPLLRQRMRKSISTSGKSTSRLLLLASSLISVAAVAAVVVAVVVVGRLAIVVVLDATAALPMQRRLGVRGGEACRGVHCVSRGLTAKLRSRTAPSCALPIGIAQSMAARAAWEWNVSSHGAFSLCVRSLVGSRVRRITDCRRQCVGPHPR